MKASNSGIVNNKIPPSVRKDGSIRKEIKVKPGYIPPEDVSAFVSQKKSQLENTIVGTSRTRNEIKPEKSIPMSTAAVKLPPVVPKVDQRTNATEQPLRKPDPIKQIRGMEKKLRQIAELEKKVNLTVEEMGKVSRKSQIEKELKDLKSNS